MEDQIQESDSNNLESSIQNQLIQENDQNQLKKKKKKNNNKKKNKDDQQNEESTNLIEKMNKKFEQSNIMNKKPKFSKFDKIYKQVQQKQIDVEQLVKNILDQNFSQMQKDEQQSSTEQEIDMNCNMNQKKKKIIQDIDKQISQLEEKIQELNKFRETELMEDVLELIEVGEQNLKDDMENNRKFKEIVKNSNI